MKCAAIANPLAILTAIAVLTGSTAKGDNNNREFLMIALGDSYASGEGAPNAPARGANGPVWISTLCNTSDHAPGLVSVRDIRIQHPAVPFFTDTTGRIPLFACAGAGIQAGILNPQMPSLASQLDQVRAFMAPQNNHRKIDALVITIGGNDMQFDKVTETCLVSPLGTPPLLTFTSVPPSKWFGNADCNQPTTNLLLGIANPPNPFYVGTMVSNNLGRLPQLLQTMAQQISQLSDPQRGPWVRNVYLIGYPEVPRGGNDAPCDQSPLPDFVNLDAAESLWAVQNFIQPINQALSNAVSIANASGVTRWHFVPMQTEDSDLFRGHGICADPTTNYTPGTPNNRFFNTGLDSAVIQHDASGTMHPNVMGYGAIGGLLSSAMNPLFGAPATPIGFTVTNVSTGSIDLRWTPVPSGVADSYVLWDNGNPIATVPWNGPMTFSVTNFVLGQTHSFDLAACNGSIGGAFPSCSPTVSVTVTPQTPPAPSNLTATSRTPFVHGVPGDPFWDLAWTNNSSFQTEMRVEGSSGGLFSTIHTLGPTASKVSLGPLTDTEFRVRACFYNICSVPSNTAP